MLDFYKKIILNLRFGFIFCNVCGNISRISVKSNNFREGCTCKKCNSNSRKRHIAMQLLDNLNQKSNLKIKSLKNIPNNLDLKIYNTESNGALHYNLKHTKGYICSEYFGDENEFGKTQNGILNIDLMKTEFEDSKFNYIISSEVFEHIPNPYKAFKETQRILKTGGLHIFTVPFHPNGEKDVIKAKMNSENEIIYLENPEYHGDPVRSDKGILVFTIFSKEILIKLKNLGFEMLIDKRENIVFGILGNDNYVFTATKN